MNYTKSPFLIHKHFISPSLCEQFVEALPYKVPDVEGEQLLPVPQTISNDVCQKIIIDKIQQSNLIERLENHYKGFEFNGCTKIEFTRLFENSQGIKPHCDNSQYIDGEWAQVKPYCLSLYISLNTHNDKPPFDYDTEVYGGKYEFQTHNFGFNPEAGTLIIHPSAPNFINSHTKINHGELTFAKFYFLSKKSFNYDMDDYPGSYLTWFQGM